MEGASMQGNELAAGDRDCIMYKEENARFILIQPTDENDQKELPEEIHAIRTSGIPFLLISVSVLDWGRELVPWEADAPFGNSKFGSDAGEFLELIRTSVIPKARQEAPGAGLVIGGYSLAGLFALWSSFQTDAFAGCAAASPSVWIDGWMEYARTHAPLAGAYSLSLGDREEKAKNPLLRTVGTCMKQQVEILENDIDKKCGNIRNVSFHMNAGNHFQDSGKRTGDVFAQAMRMALKIEDT